MIIGNCFKWLSLWLYSWKGLWTMFAITLEIERKESNSCLDHRNLWSDLCSYFAYGLWQNHPGIYLYVFIPIALFPFSLPFVTKYWSLFLLITFPVSCGGLRLISEIICINHIYLFLEGQLYSLFCPSMVFFTPRNCISAIWCILVCNLIVVCFTCNMIWRHINRFNLNSLILQAPVSVEGTQEVAERVAPVFSTIFGKMWVFTADGSHSDTAYSTQHLGAHTDNTYLVSPAGYVT